MLSTTDNPYNPHTHYDEWRDWDVSHGYNTESYLAEIASILSAGGRVSDAEATNLAVEEIMGFNITGNYILVPEPA